MKELLFKTLWTILFRVILGVRIKQVPLEEGCYGKVRQDSKQTIYIGDHVSFASGFGDELLPISNLLWHEWVHTMQFRGYKTGLGLPPQGAFYRYEYLYTNRNEAEAEAFAFIMTGRGLDLHCTQGVEWLIKAYWEFLCIPQYARLLKRAKITPAFLQNELRDYGKIEEYFLLWQENEFRRMLGQPKKYSIPMLVEYLIREKGFYYEYGKEYD